MGELTLILGGVRSGKSKFAVECAKGMDSVLYIATYKRIGGDKEMEERIEKHIMARPRDWKVVEEPIELNEVIGREAGVKIILIDCVTLWVSNLIMNKNTVEEISDRTMNLVRMIKKSSVRFILVSNEVGMGIAPHTKLGRRFRDIAGVVNQIIAEAAEQVYFVVAGIPIKVA